MIEIAVKPLSGVTSSARFTISGDLCLNHSERIFKELLSAIKTYDSLIISCEQIQDFDLAAYQILFSAQSSYPGIEIELALDSELRQLFNHAGLSTPFKNPNPTS